MTYKDEAGMGNQSAGLSAKLAFLEQDVIRLKTEARDRDIVLRELYQRVQRIEKDIPSSAEPGPQDPNEVTDRELDARPDM